MNRLEGHRAWTLGMLLFLAGCAPRGLEALRQGDAALAANRPAEAVPLLERAVTDRPADAVAWNHLGLAYQETGRPEEARKAYLRALQFDRNFFDVHFNLGALEFEAGRWAETERALRTYLGVERNRTNITAWRLLGEAQLATKQLDAAERTLTTALQIEPQDPAARHSLGLTLAQKRRWREAQAQFARVVQVTPADTAARLNLAIASQQAGDRRGALEHYRAYLELNPSAPAADAVRAQIQQIELSLAPPALVATNAVALKPAPNTNSIRSLPGTNLVAAPSPRPTNSVPSRAPTNPTPLLAVARPVTNPPPALRPTPVEVIRVEESPPLQVARDVTPPPEVRNEAPAPANPSPDQSPAATPAPIPDSIPTAAAGNDLNSTARKTFWQRINPVTWGNPAKWFRGSPEATNPPVADTVAARNPSPAPTLNLPPASAPAAPVSETPSFVRPPPPKPVIVRYPRSRPPTVTPGNRPAAEAAAKAGTADRLGAWQRAVELDPSWTEAWMQVGRLALESGRPAAALPAGEAAVILDPQSAGAHQLFAAALSRTGYPSDAAEELERAVSLAPGNASVHLSLAGFYARDLGEPALARPHYERVLALDPQNPQAAAIRLWLANNK